MANRELRKHKEEQCENNTILPADEKRITSKPTIYINTETGECLTKKEKEQKEEEGGSIYVESSNRYIREEINPYHVRLQKVSYGKFTKIKYKQLTLF